MDKLKSYSANFQAKDNKYMPVDKATKANAKRQVREFQVHKKHVHAVMCAYPQYKCVFINNNDDYDYDEDVKPHFAIFVLMSEHYGSGLILSHNQFYKKVGGKMTYVRRA